MNVIVKKKVALKGCLGIKIKLCIAKSGVEKYVEIRLL